MKPKNYRSDIDGLRAIAVLSVIFYHYGLENLPGGFVGVDIFFVISGYLITSIVHSEITAGSFTFTEFYIRRIRRIFPALLLVIFTTLFLSAAMMLPSDVITTAKGAIANSFFAANILFWRSSGYFDASSHLNPLLHTWSLAVEEQFYFIFPLILLATIRWKPAWTKRIVAIGIFISFSACVFFQVYRPTATFYLTPFRAWELGIGAILALNALPKSDKRSVNEIFAWIGITLIVIGITQLHEGREFPGWQASVPVLGAAMVIHTGTAQATTPYRILSIAPLRFVGLISYSLYLWHWPVYVFLLYANSFNPLDLMVWPALGIVGFLSYISFRFIEQPFRRVKFTHSNSQILSASALSMILLTSTSAMLILLRGLPQRFSAQIVQVDEQRNPVIPYIDCIGNTNYNNRLCHLGNYYSDPQILLWGDSHALSWAPIIDLISRGSSSVMFSFYSGCPPLINVSNPASPKCKDFNDDIIQLISSNRNIKHVILHASWLSYSMDPGQYQIVNQNGDIGNRRIFKEAFVQTIKTLRAAGVSISVIGPTPSAPGDLPLKLAFAALSDHYKMPPRIPYSVHKRNSTNFYEATSIAANHFVFVLKDPSTLLCDQDYCNYMEGNQLLYRDGGHLMYPGSLFLADMKDTKDLIEISTQTRH